MKIVNTFIFGEPHETELLLLKLRLESNLVHEWVITESAFTFQGEPKDFHAENILNGDHRFREFVPRIKIISCSEYKSGDIFFHG